MSVDAFQALIFQEMHQTKATVFDSPDDSYIPGLMETPPKTYFEAAIWDSPCSPTSISIRTTSPSTPLPSDNCDNFSWDLDRNGVDLDLEKALAVIYVSVVKIRINLL